MYTTIEMLKRDEACASGYGRMLSFFGQTAEAKTQRIPLHAVALVGGYEDVSWATTNSLIIEPTDYLDLRERTLVSVLHTILADEVNDNALSNPGTRHQYLAPLLADLDKILVANDVEAFMAKARGFTSDHPVWEEVLNNAIWSGPAAYIDAVVGNAHRTVRSNSWVGRSLLRIAGAAEAAVTPPKSKSRAKSTRELPSTKFVQKPTDVPLFPASTLGTTRGQQIAHVLRPEPFAWLDRLSVRLPAGATRIVHNDVPSIVMSCTNKERTFALLKALSAKAAVPDQV